MKFRRIIALLALAAVAPAFAQDAAPIPAPLPMFHAPLATDAVPAEATDAQLPAEPATPAADTSPPAATAATDAIAQVSADPQPLTLSASIMEGGAPINEGLMWRVFGTKPDPSGQLVLAAKSDSAIAKVNLPPGDYVVHVAYGRAQASDTITIKPGDNSASIVLDAGGLRLNAAVTGDVPIPINLLRFDIFTSGQSDADRALVVQDLGANDIVTLNAGTYHIVSYFGDRNAVVRADLRVEPGKLTDVTLYHRAAQVSFKLVSQAGGEAIADIDWTVKTADGTTVFTDTGAFPSTVLQEGDYLVLAKRGDKVYNREFQITPGHPQEIEVLTTVF